MSVEKCEWKLEKKCRRVETHSLLIIFIIVYEGLAGQLVVGADYIHQIWVPDTFFVNEKVARFHAATQENQFLRITSKGEILRR